MNDPPTIGPDDLDRDDEFLDILGRGEMPAGGDQVGVLLAAWRADLAEAEAPQRSSRPLRAAVPGSDVSARVPVRATAHATRPTSKDRDGRRPPGGPASERPGRRGPWRIRLAIAAAVVLLGAGVATAAANATPDSPLWPVAQLLFPQRADRLGAEDAIAQAQTAIREGRIADARRLLAQAQGLVAQVNDPVERSGLQGELDKVGQLLAAVGSAVSPSAAPTPRPASSGQPAPSATAGSGPGSLLPSQLPNPGLPSLLPTGILPNQILPTSLLPTLPILGG